MNKLPIVQHTITLRPPEWWKDKDYDAALAVLNDINLGETLWQMAKAVLEGREALNNIAIEINT